MITLAEVAGLFQTDNAGDELELFNSAVTVFEKYEVPGYLEAFDATISAAIDDGDGDVIRSIMIDIRAISESLLSMQGITLNEDVLLSELLELADTVHEFPFHEDRETMLTALDVPESSEEIFARLVELQSGQPVEKTLGMISEVNENIVEIVRAIFNHHDEVQRVQTQDNAIIECYKTFKERCAAGVSLVADQWIRQAPTIGLDLGFYVDQLVLLKHIDLTNPQQETFDLLALELFGVAVLSCDGNATPAQALREHQEKFFTDLSDVTKLDMAVGKISKLYSTQP